MLMLFPSCNNVETVEVLKWLRVSTTRALSYYGGYTGCTHADAELELSCSYMNVVVIPCFSPKHRI